MDRIIRLDNGASLYQGGWGDDVITLTKKSDITVVALMAEEYQKAPDHLTKYFCPLDDSMSLSKEDRSMYNKVTNILATTIYNKHLMKGESVLSSCAMGLNRSGLLSAKLLILLGMSPEEAVATIKSNRHGALSNDLFVKMIKETRKRKR